MKTPRQMSIPSADEAACGFFSPPSSLRLRRRGNACETFIAHERFGLLGGEDTHFFMRVYLRGAKLVWAADARVYESIPASRMSVSWLLRREYRRGNTLSLCLRELEDSGPRRLKRVAHGLVQLGQGAVLVVAAPVFGRYMLVRGLQRGAFGAGLITGLGAHVYEEYGVKP